ncbi:MAG: hypothetical protein ACKVWV_03660 [Planctomycetota bacterium]
MSKPTLLTELYYFLLDLGVVHFSELEARFPNEFRVELEAGDTCASPTVSGSSPLGRRQMSDAMKDAICFLLAEEFVEFLSSGSLVRRHAAFARTEEVSSWHLQSGVPFTPSVVDSARN